MQQTREACVYFGSIPSDKADGILHGFGRWNRLVRVTKAGQKPKTPAVQRLAF